MTVSQCIRRLSSLCRPAFPFSAPSLSSSSFCTSFSRSSPLVSFIQSSLSLSEEEVSVLNDHPSLASSTPSGAANFSRNLSCLRSVGMLDSHLRELALAAPEMLLLCDEDILRRKVEGLKADGVLPEDFPQLLRLEEYDQVEDTARYQAQLADEANRGKPKTKKRQQREHPESAISTSLVVDSIRRLPRQPEICQRPLRTSMLLARLSNFATQQAPVLPLLPKHSISSAPKFTMPPVGRYLESIGVSSTLLSEIASQLPHNYLLYASADSHLFDKVSFYLNIMNRRHLDFREWVECPKLLLPECSLNQTLAPRFEFCRTQMPSNLSGPPWDLLSLSSLIHYDNDDQFCTATLQVDPAVYSHFKQRWAQQSQTHQQELTDQRCLPVAPTPNYIDNLVASFIAAVGTTTDGLDSSNRPLVRTTAGELRRRLMGAESGVSGGASGSLQLSLCQSESLLRACAILPKDPSVELLTDQVCKSLLLDTQTGWRHQTCTILCSLYYFRKSNCHHVRNLVAVYAGRIARHRRAASEESTHLLADCLHVLSSYHYDQSSSVYELLANILAAPLKRGEMLKREPVLGRMDNHRFPFPVIGHQTLPVIGKLDKVDWLRSLAGEQPPTWLRALGSFSCFSIPYFHGNFMFCLRDILHTVGYMDHLSLREQVALLVYLGRHRLYDKDIYDQLAKRLTGKLEEVEDLRDVAAVLLSYGIANHKDISLFEKGYELVIKKIESKTIDAPFIVNGSMTILCWSFVFAGLHTKPSFSSILDIVLSHSRARRLRPGFSTLERLEQIAQCCMLEIVLCPKLCQEVDWLLECVGGNTDRRLLKISDCSKDVSLVLHKMGIKHHVTHLRPEYICFEDCENKLRIIVCRRRTMRRWDGGELLDQVTGFDVVRQRLFTIKGWTAVFVTSRQWDVLSEADREELVATSIGECRARKGLHEDETLRVE
eukprot:GHVS01052726.1.p1 GENE.GHVS01052726.1~~GHVS01052726.1.p1  ORF type:complete len:998 (+),score=112.84 GHVS01052726.1:171-2996(+)